MLADTIELARRGRHPQGPHTAAVVPAVSGVALDQVTVPATPAGYQQLLKLASQQPGQRGWAIESTGGYGAGLTRFLQAHAEQVVELTGPSGPPAATAPSPTPGCGQGGPRGPGPRPARPAQSRRPSGGVVGRLAARRSAVNAASDAQRQLHALVVAAPIPCAAGCAA
jgi:transposase